MMTVNVVESYTVLTENSPRVKLMAKSLSVDLGNFDEYEVVRDCTNSTSFGLASSYLMEISQGVELVFEGFTQDNLTDFECRIDWSYEAVMEDGSELPTFIRFLEDERTLIAMPHSTEEIGNYKVVLIAQELSEGKEILEVKESVTFSFDDG